MQRHAFISTKQCTPHSFIYTPNVYLISSPTTSAKFIKIFGNVIFFFLYITLFMCSHILKRLRLKIFQFMLFLMIEVLKMQHSIFLLLLLLASCTDKKYSLAYSSDTIIPSSQCRRCRELVIQKIHFAHPAGNEVAAGF